MPKIPVIIADTSGRHLLDALSQGPHTQAVRSIASKEAGMNHPHPDKRHVMRVIRHYLVGEKARRGTARVLGHYHDLLRTYLTAKRLTIGSRC